MVSKFSGGFYSMNNLKKIMAAAIVLMTVATVTFAAGKGDKASFKGNFAFGGSTTVEPIVNAAITEIKALYPDVYISYDAQGSSVGIKGVISGTYSLGGSSRDLKDSEKKEGVKATAIALDGVAIIVSSDVPVENLTLEQIAGIFAGEITNWKALGGPDKAIVVFNRDEASGTRDCFNSLVTAPVKKSFTSSAAIVTSNGDMVSKVGSTPYAIGYCGFGYIGKNPKTKAVSVNGIKPMVVNVKNKTYPISRELLIVCKGDLVEGTLEWAFVQYLLSPDGQAIVAEEKFIPLK
jgi:phosphate transport system substrate-binding protein